MDDRERNPEPGERVSAQARAFVVRLASGAMSDAELDQLKAWRALSLEHERAFARERAFWQHLQAVEPAAARTARPSRRTLILGGGAVAAAAAGVAFAPDIRLLWEADYRTGPGEQISLTLPDGSLATLNTDSALAVDYGADLRLVRLLRGEALFEVREAALPFRAAAMGGATQMGAGSVALRAIGEEASVLLTGGTASVFAPAPEGSALPSPRDRVELAPAQETHYRMGMQPSLAMPFDADAELAWRSGRVIFEGEPFAAALAELARYVPERVVLGGGARSGEPVSAIFSIRQANEAILALARTQDLSVRRIPGLVIYVA